MAKNTNANKNTKSDAQLMAELEGAGIAPDTAAIAAVVTNSLQAGTSEAAASTTTTTARRASTGGNGNGRPRIDPGATPSQVLAAHITDKSALHTSAVLVRGDEANGTTFNKTAKALDGLAKKVAEKGVNLLRYRGEPDKVQVYTRLGLNQLIEQGEATSKSLVTMFQSKYKDGTARAQANQLMSLFPALGIAERDGSNLKLSKQSAIVHDYKRASAKSGS